MGEPYNIIVADPPWNESGGGKIKRGAARHYPLMKTPQIVETMRGQLDDRTTDTALMFLWVTNNFLVDGLGVMRECGFEYITNIVWVKDRFGLGYYFRGQHELCLFGRKKPPGRPPKTETTYTTVLGGGVIPRGRHSQKPSALQEMIEDRWAGPYLELFARTARPGWDAWGNEVAS